mgnify:CR=1 FL=1
MELSPLAREKLARIGELTEEEKSRLKYSEQLTSLLAEYFTNEFSPDDLWKELKEHKDAGRVFILIDAQLKLLEAISLSGSEADFDKVRRGILAIETLKDEGNYTTLEQDLNGIDTLRRQYRDERDRTYRSMQEKVERQVSLAAEQVARQAATRGTVVDVQGSVEATIKASPEWKAFVSRHENTYGQKLKEYLTGLKERLKA